jgi:hypothetical protein
MNFEVFEINDEKSRAFLRDAAWRCDGPYGRGEER